ncbi:dihydrodipicolinate reductase [candidate division KSB1 bacterium]
MKYNFDVNLPKDTLNVVQFGLGPIGINTVKAAMKKDMVKVVGAVDIDPEKKGKDLGEILGLEERLGIEVVADIAEVFEKTHVDVVLHTTSSFVKTTFNQFKQIMEGGANVVSSTEELLMPDFREPELGKKLNEIAKANNVSCLGTGVNPGFVMDTLPVFVSSMCTDVEHVYAEREVDASTRREPLQRKVGAGLTLKEWQDRADADKLGHRGLMETVAFVTRAMGWQLDSMNESLEPMIADRDITTQYLTVKKGEPAGIKNCGFGYVGDKEVIKVDLRMYVGARNPHDAVRLKSNPPVDIVVNGGFAGDIATVSSLVNNINTIYSAPPGLHTMMTLSLPRIFNGSTNF